MTRLTLRPPDERGGSPSPERTEALRAAFLRLAAELASCTAGAAPPGRAQLDAIVDAHVSGGRDVEPRLEAAGRVLRDLAHHGLKLTLDEDTVVVTRRDDDEEPDAERRARVRRGELIKRDEQLREPAKRARVESLERRSWTSVGCHSIYSLMRDGRELAPKLRAAAQLEGSARAAALAKAVDPYLQVIRDDEPRCPQTGLNLKDIWAYFRQTWANQYVSTPGRSMMFLIRDRAAPHHPVMGLGQLSSAVVQLTSRDKWIGWHPDDFIERAAEVNPDELCEWLERVHDAALSELLIDDLLGEEVIPPSALRKPKQQHIDRLLKVAEQERDKHHGGTHPGELKRAPDKGGVPASVAEWEARARAPLFKSKRALALADVLHMRRAAAVLRGGEGNWAAALRDPVAQKGLKRALRKVKKDRVGISIADLSVCGAVAPYNHLLGGKLAALLAVSPEIVHAYRERYSASASQIASSMAGRPIERRPDLVMIGTTSLYGVTLNQYTRVRIPAEVVNDPSGSGIRYSRRGESRAYGSSQFSAPTVDALVRLVERERGGVRVNSLFGEGVNPKMRKLREGISRLFGSQAADDLLNHGRGRVIYAVKLADNMSEHLLGWEPEPRWRFDPNMLPSEATARIAAYWRDRWLAPRVGRPDMADKVAQHTLVHPVRHGARVKLPELPPDEDDDQLDLFGDFD